MNTNQERESPNKRYNFIKQCREEGLSLWVCPNFLFVFTGLIAAAVIAVTYFMASFYFTPEVVIILSCTISFIMMIISYLVNQGVTKITQAKKQLSETNADLLKALKEIKREKKLREDFTTMLVHDLRSPLEAIRLIMELFHNKKSISRKEIQESFQSINHSATNMSNLVSNLLDVAKFERGKFIVHRQLGDLKRVMALQKENFSILAAGKNIKLFFQIADNLPSVAFDEYALNRVLANLLVNAIKFTEVNGRIIIQAIYCPEGRKIESIAKRSGIKWFINSSSPSISSISNSVIVAVTDNGIGIVKDKLDKLFLSFSQIAGDQGTIRTGIPLGTGLGLSIAKVIVQAHGGIINVASKEDEGSTFYFSLPTA